MFLQQWACKYIRTESCKYHLQLDKVVSLRSIYGKKTAFGFSAKPAETTTETKTAFGWSRDSIGHVKRGEFQPNEDIFTASTCSKIHYSKIKFKLSNYFSVNLTISIILY